jgi:hypothetical protein
MSIESVDEAQPDLPIACAASEVITTGCKFSKWCKTSPMIEFPEGEEIDGEWVIDDQAEAEREAIVRREIQEAEERRQEAEEHRVQEAVEAAIAADQDQEARTLAERQAQIEEAQRADVESGAPPRTHDQIERDWQELAEISKEAPPPPPPPPTKDEGLDFDMDGEPDSEEFPDDGSDGAFDGGDSGAGADGGDGIVEPERFLAAEEPDGPDEDET